MIYSLRFGPIFGPQVLPEKSATAHAWQQPQPSFGQIGAFDPVALAPEGRPRAKMALNELAPPPIDHPQMLHAANVRAELEKQGLPANAKDVRVYVLGEQSYLFTPAMDRDHGASIARTIAGPSGLARGADLQLLDPQSLVPRIQVTPHEGAARMTRGFKANSGQATFSDAILAGVDQLETQIDRTGGELRKLSERVPSDGKTSIASLSWGESPFRVGINLANAAIAQGNDAPLIKDVNALRAKNGERPLDVKNPRDAGRLRGYVVEGLMDEIAAGPSKTRLDAAKKTLEADVAAARSKNILPIVAAGNEHLEGINLHGADRSAIAGVKGILTVGAADLDGNMAGFSNEGADVAAPGVKMPVGRPTKPGEKTPADVEGTSFAAPYAASVAALMVKANPKLTPDQIEAILKSATKDLPGDRDGAGMIDAAECVRRAKATAQ